MKNFFKIIFLYIFTTNVSADNSDGLVSEINFYFNTLNNFSASFIQSNDSDLQEGFFYKEDSRIRIDYMHPSKITILLDEKKAMYLNHELEEVEYFNPKNTVGKIVFDIFNNNFLEGFQKAEFGDNFAIFYLDYKDEDYFYIIEITFELNPLQIRMVKFDNQEEKFSFGLKDHNFNNSFNKNFFSMANPLLRNTKEK